MSRAQFSAFPGNDPMAEEMFETTVEPTFLKNVPTLPHARWTLCQALEKKLPIFD